MQKEILHVENANIDDKGEGGPWKTKSQYLKLFGPIRIIGRQYDRSMGNLCTFVRKIMFIFQNFLLKTAQAELIIPLWQKEPLTEKSIIPSHKIPGNP